MRRERSGSALAAARDHQLDRAGWDVQADGLFGAPELTVVIGEKAHSTVVKALGLLGLGRNRVRRVPADDQGRMRADCLPEDVTGPVVICAQAGEVNTGAFDPFPAIVDWARRHQAWLHVDGAFGMWALADPSRSHLTAGLAAADSWATDGHKWLNVPYDCGIALVRRPGDLRRSFAAAAAYLPPDTGFEATNHTPQSSQRARQVEVWAVLRTLGRPGVTDLVTRTCRHAQAMAAYLSQAGLEVLNDVVLNQVLIRAATDDQTLALIRAVQQDGTCWCGPTVWQHRPAMRISISGWATTAEGAKAVLGNGLGRPRDALAAAERATEYHGDMGFSKWALVELVEAAVHAGMTQTAAGAYRRLTAMTGPAGTDWALGLAARSRALLTDGDEADGSYREAIDRLGQTRLRVELARAHLLYGEWLRRGNRRGDARVQLRTAHEMLDAMGLAAFAERARRELAAAGETVRANSVDAVTALTAQEAYIARLARDGRTNAEISAQLFLSVRTVEWHLRKIFTKLGIGSRRELRTALDHLGPDRPAA